MIRVTHVSSAPFTGGAARAGLRLHEGLLLKDDVQSTWLDGSGAGDGLAVVKLPSALPKLSLPKRIRRKLWQTPFEKLPSPTDTPFSDPRGWGTIKMFQHSIPDVWNLHWVSWLMNWETVLPWMAEQAPIVWTLHDLNPLRGLWHYEPTASEQTEPWQSMELQSVQQKRRAVAAIPKDRITFVGPSQWMAGEVARSQVTEGFNAECIPYGINTEVFCPTNRQILRDICEVADGALVVGFLADSVSDPRKGMSQLAQAISLLDKSLSIHIVTVGRGGIELSSDCAHTYLGPLRSDRLLRSFYSGCDLFVCPSLQDNLPCTVMESLACGTPVLSFDVGGLPDMIREGVSGTVVSPVGDPNAMADAMSKLLANPNCLQELRHTSRQLAKEEYSLSTQANRYRAMYANLGKAN
ncbi:MAG: glycosyltransferase [Fuerstiella sp.]